MQLSALFNFAEQIQMINEHDWASYPILTLLGPEEAGKTALANFLVEEEISAGKLVCHLSQLSHFSSNQAVLERALECDAMRALSETRSVLRGQPQVLIENSSFTRTKVKIRIIQWPWSRKRQPSVGASSQLLSLETLMNDLQSVGSGGLLVVDPVEDFRKSRASEFTRQAECLDRLLSAIETRVQRGATIRVILVGVSANDRLDRSMSLEVPPLTSDAVEVWCKQLSLNVTASECEFMIEATGGLAGKIWELLASLYHRRIRLGVE